MTRHEMVMDAEDKKSTSNRVSRVYVVVLGMIIVALLMTTITFTVLYMEEPEVIEYCNTEGCRTAASDLMRSINPKVNPCDDFYEFACGNWNKSNPMPEERSRWGVFDLLRVDLSRTLRSLLEKEESDAVDVIKKMRTYYSSCIDEDAIEDAGVQPLSEVLMDVFPQAVNFPFNNANAPTIIEVFSAFTQARRYGLTLGIMSNGVSSDPDNSRVNIIEFDVGKLPMERDFYLKTENTTELTAYKKYLVDMFQLFARKMQRKYTPEQAAEAADGLISFETHLAQIRLSPQERREPSTLKNKMTIREFAENFTSPIGINAAAIVRYFETAWNNASVNEVLSEESIINVAEPIYFRNMTTDLANMVRTENGRSAFGNYLVWQIGRAYVDRLGAEFRNISLEFSSAIQGIRLPTPRWESCINIINNEFPNAIGRLYVFDNFKQSTKKELEGMVNYLFDAFREMIQEANWMTEETKNRAIKKSENFAVLIGYEDYIVSETERLNQEHALFNATKSYLANVFSMQRLMVKDEGKSLLTALTPTSWITGAAIVNAFYAPTLNSISFPAGILQPPFLGADYPKYWNFGAIGTVIGHEITHGFDNRGAQFDEHGNLNVIPGWWDKESWDKFTNRTDALREQYSGYSLMGVQINGSFTIGENIADNGGLKESFRGYRAYIKNQHDGKPEPRLPNLTFSPEQLFFLANAQLWCGDYRLKALEAQVRTDPHSPGRFRVIGPMQNFDEFSNTFSCPVGSYMNPEKKNIVW